MIDIIEHSLVPKAPDIPTEDAIVVTPCFCAVIDGATSKDHTSVYGPETPGQVAARLLSTSIKSLPPLSSAEEAVCHLTLSIAGYCRARFGEAAALRHPSIRPTASVALFSLHRKAVWLFGDCQCRFGGHTYTNNKLIDSILAQIRSDILCYLLQRGRSESERERIKSQLQRSDLGRKFIADALHDQQTFQNGTSDNPYSYAVIDGTPFPLSAIRTFHVDSGELILASDGYPVLCDSLHETEEKLHELNQKDPLCIRDNKQTKGILPSANSYDDRSYLRFRFQ